MGGGNSIAVVDPEALDRLRAFGGPVLVGQIVELFCDVAAERIAAVESAVLSTDPAKVRRAAHVLRGSADSVGASAVVAVAADIEAHSDDAASGPDCFAGLLSDLRDECEEACARLRQVAADVTSAWT